MMDEGEAIHALRWTQGAIFSAPPDMHQEGTTPLPYMRKPPVYRGFSWR